VSPGPRSPEQWENKLQRTLCRPAQGCVWIFTHFSMVDEFYYAAKFFIAYILLK
jgi:hypothetical protein